MEIIKIMRHVLVGLKVSFAFTDTASTCHHVAWSLINLRCFSARQYLHLRNLVHLDLKPSNLFIKKGVYKIGDLGHITQQRRSRSRRGSTHHHHNGDGACRLNSTPSEGDSCYMPRELLNYDSNNPFDLRKCDIFSLGASIYEVVRGVRLPQRGDEWHAMRNGTLHFPTNTNPPSVLTTPAVATAAAAAAAAAKPHQEPISISTELEQIIRKVGFLLLLWWWGGLF